MAPTTTNVLCMYAAYLARFLLPKSVHIYLNVVSLIHKEMGFPNPLADNWVLSTVLAGIKRVHGVPPQPRLPITVQLLYLIKGRLNLQCSKHASFWAICLTAFFGLFRKFHLLPVSADQFDSKKQFTRADFIPFTKGYLVHVRYSKTIQMGERTVYIPLIACPNSPLCPVSAVRQAFFLTPEAENQSQAFC